MYVASGLFSPSRLGLFPRRAEHSQKSTPAPVYLWYIVFWEESQKNSRRDRERAVKRLEKEKHVNSGLFSTWETHQEKRHSSLGFFIIVSGEDSQNSWREERGRWALEKESMNSISADEVNAVILHAYFGFVPITYLMLQFIVDYSHPGINRWFRQAIAEKTIGSKRVPWPGGGGNPWNWLFITFVDVITWTFSMKCKSITTGGKKSSIWSHDHCQ